MRIKTMLTLLGLAAVIVSTASAAVGMKVTLKTPPADPTIEVPWPYSVKATDLKGKPLKATLTAQVIALGVVYPVDYGPSDPAKPVTNFPFTGTFRDKITFPPESKGINLTLRWIVKAKIGGKPFKKVLTRKATLTRA
jgi:hypothetical protein